MNCITQEVIIDLKQMPNMFLCKTDKCSDFLLHYAILYTYIVEGRDIL